MTIEKIVRVPNLPTGQMVDEAGNPVDDELTFRQTLISSLQQNFGEEGLVMPTQYETVTQDYVTQIQNHQNIAGQYTCQLGTLLYVIADPTDHTLDKVMVAVRNDDTYPNTPPIFKEIQLI